MAAERTAQKPGAGAAHSAMLRPIIAIVGRPNVGKSTLFNRLVGQRRAIVRDVPGVTRDRLYGQVAFERWQATAIDTGGFDPSSEEPLIEGVRKQVLAAVEEADLVLFVVDARGQESALAELYRLGFGDPVPVSAEHGRGVAEMLEVLRARTAESPPAA